MTTIWSMYYCLVELCHIHFLSLSPIGWRVFYIIFILHFHLHCSYLKCYNVFRVHVLFRSYSVYILAHCQEENVNFDGRIKLKGAQFKYFAALVWLNHVFHFLELLSESKVKTFRFFLNSISFYHVFNIHLFPIHLFLLLLPSCMKWKPRECSA